MQESFLKDIENKGNKNILLYLYIFLLAIFPGCRGRGELFYYRRPRPASYYTNRYCFEVPKERVFSAARWALLRYKFPIEIEEFERGYIKTKPIYMATYSRDPERGYRIGLKVKIREYRGKISLKGIPRWALERGKSLRIEKEPERRNFRDEESYRLAMERYLRELQERTEILERATAVMKHWEGCRVKDSVLRTVVEIESNVWEYPLGRFGNLVLEKGKRVESDLTVEYSLLRVIGWRLGKGSYMPPLLY